MKIYNVGRSALVCLLTAALVAYGGSRAYPAPSAVSISLARLRIFWSHAEASTRFQPIFVRKARPTAPVSMPYSTVRRKNRKYMWPLQVDL